MIHNNPSSSSPSSFSEDYGVDNLINIIGSGGFPEQQHQQSPNQWWQTNQSQQSERPMHNINKENPMVVGIDRSCCPSPTAITTTMLVLDSVWTPGKKEQQDLSLWGGGGGSGSEQFLLGSSPTWKKTLVNMTTNDPTSITLPALSSTILTGSTAIAPTPAPAPTPRLVPITASTPPPPGSVTTTTEQLFTPPKVITFFTRSKPLQLSDTSTTAPSSYGGGTTSGSSSTTSTTTTESSTCDWVVADEDEVSCLNDDPDVDDAAILPQPTYDVLANIFDELYKDESEFDDDDADDDNEEELDGHEKKNTAEEGGVVNDVDVANNNKNESNGVLLSSSSYPQTAAVGCDDGVERACAA